MFRRTQHGKRSENPSSFVPNCTGADGADAEIKAFGLIEKVLALTLVSDPTEIVLEWHWNCKKS